MQDIIKTIAPLLAILALIVISAIYNRHADPTGNDRETEDYYDAVGPEDLWTMPPSTPIKLKHHSGRTEYYICTMNGRFPITGKEYTMLRSIIGRMRKTGMRQ